MRTDEAQAKPARERPAQRTMNGAGLVARPSQGEAEDAVRTLIAWAGDDPARAGLAKTPRRVVEAFRDYFAGYEQSPEDSLTNALPDSHDYNDMVMLRGIRVESHCEHHMAPFIGEAHVAYVPAGKLVGLSKVARLVDIYARRLQTQERLTHQIRDALMRFLKPKGVAVLIEAEHQCMTTRGIHKPGILTYTCALSGVFETEPQWEARFMQTARKGG